MSPIIRGNVGLNYSLKLKATKDYTQLDFALLGCWTWVIRIKQITLSEKLTSVETHKIDVNINEGVSNFAAI